MSKFVLAIITLLGASLCAAAQSGGSVRNRAAALPVQTIGIDDSLEVKVYGLPELSREVRVDANGNIKLPLISRVIKLQY